MAPLLSGEGFERHAPAIRRTGGGGIWGIWLSRGVTQPSQGEILATRGDQRATYDVEHERRVRPAPHCPRHPFCREAEMLPGGELEGADKCAEEADGEPSVQQLKPLGHYLLFHSRPEAWRFASSEDGGVAVQSCAGWWGQRRSCVCMCACVRARARALPVSTCTKSCISLYLSITYASSGSSTYLTRGLASAHSTHKIRQSVYCAQSEVFWSLIRDG